MIKQLGIKKFIILAISCFAIASVVSFAALTIYNKNATNRYIEKANISHEKSSFINTFTNSFSSIHSQTASLLTEKDMDRLEKKITTNISQLDLLEKSITHCKANHCSNLSKVLTDYHRNSDNLINNKILLGKNAEAIDYFINHLNTNYLLVTQEINKINLTILSQNKELDSESSSIANRQIYIISTFAVIFNIVLVTGGFYLASSIIGTTSSYNIQLKETSKEVSKTATLISSNSDKVLQTSVMQSIQVKNANQAIQVISELEDQNIKSLIEITNDSLVNHRVIEQGKDSFEIMNKSIKIIRDSNNKIIFQISKNENEFNKVTQLIREIDSKTKIINEIAFQTKLLSFNASVEAARAGEHGKGFAVVAQEIGNLANLSSSSSIEISKLLNSSIQQVNEILRIGQEEMGNIVADALDRIEESRLIAVDCQKVFSKIDVDSKVTNTNLDSVSSNAQELTRKITEIHKMMESIQSLATENENIVADFYKSSTSLINQNVLLDEFVGEFSKLVDSKS